MENWISFIVVFIIFIKFVFIFFSIKKDEKIFKFIVVIGMFVLLDMTLIFFPLNIRQTKEIKHISKEYLLKGYIYESITNKSYVEIIHEKHKFLLFYTREREYINVYIGEDIIK
jgi:hypothetical protein